MYGVTIQKEQKGNYYNFTLISADKSHYLNVYISQYDNSINVLISKSEDGFNFKSPCDEATGLELNTSASIEETFEFAKEHFHKRGYEFSNFE